MPLKRFLSSNIKTKSDNFLSLISAKMLTKGIDFSQSVTLNDSFAVVSETDSI